MNRRITDLPALLKTSQPCECMAPGYCQRMKRYVGESVIKQCRYNDSFRLAMEKQAAHKVDQLPKLDKNYYKRVMKRSLRAGVVLGSYGMPRLIELQIKLIRHHCGEVPIRVVDDCSPGFGPTPKPGSKFDTLLRICNDHNVTLRTTGPSRIGHAGGDVAVFWHGIQWAFDLDMDVLAKISQRFLVDRPDWLRHGALELLHSGKPIASQQCLDGNSWFELRTEACLLDVEKWHQPSILNHLFPRELQATAETIIWHDVRDRLGNEYHPWSLLPFDRGQPIAGVVWHCSNPIEDYKKLANQFGVKLDSDFTCDAHWKSGNYRLG